MIDADTVLAYLEYRCERCEGEGREAGNLAVNVSPSFHPCPACHGSGQLLTLLGEEVIGFVQRHISTPVHR